LKSSIAISRVPAFRQKSPAKASLTAASSRANEAAVIDHMSIAREGMPSSGRQIAVDQVVVTVNHFPMA
jgi:hypothetical protein